MLALPRLSIAAILYTIFALLAAATMALAGIAIFNCLRQAALTSEVQVASQGALNVERVDAMIYAVVMESRGVYMSTEADDVRVYAKGLRDFNQRLVGIMEEWKRVESGSGATGFNEFSDRVQQFIKFREELARLATEVSQPAGRAWGDNYVNRSLRKALNKDIETLAKFYRERLKRLHADLDEGIHRTTLVLTALAGVALMLAGIGIIVIWRAVARPLAEITRVTAAVAAGTAVSIPFGERRDEVGELARSIGVFQEAMHRNDELTRTIIDEAQTRAKRQDQLAAEIDRFGGEVEATVADLGRIADQMAGAAGQLAAAADQASRRADGAAAASGEASGNVRDIASAAEELSSSVMEIDRQVSHSNTIAAKAVGEAERTNAEIKALDEAAKRIGDVVKLITAIAEQTNLLALNATIEAARAGEAGRGFAVVASEVKALAGQTAKATEEISAQIAGMQQATVRSVDAIGTIQRTIREVGDITATIAAAVTEQGAATREIARSADIASKRTVETVEEVGRVSEATADTRGNAETVKAVADDLGAVAGRVRGQVDGFFQKLRA
ncbi:MAG TPA: methyl-accepting chemotaxis protein [Xanthobacteraceae bacterium]|jgi:methyl-accepting chemotaxis protein|nr:methyl-accepting chemotaxis protein [Xanthobacteraceae bacterium]